MMTIDRRSPVPIYHQLRTLIEGRIERGLWRPGDQIPTERELCEAHGISRSPVRQALNALAHEGLLVRKPGLGTFVANHGLHELSGEVSIAMMCSDPQWSSVLDHVSNVWNAWKPDRKITFDVDVVPHAEFYGLLSAAVGSGTAPDMAMVDGVWVAGLAESGFLTTLENLDSPWDHSHFHEDLYPVCVHANSLNGRLYGLPVKADASVLWYRRDWFAQEGLSAPKDWGDLLQVAAHFLRAEVEARYGLRYPLAFPGGAAGGEATVYSLLPLVWSAGGEIVDADKRHITLDSPETSRALRFLRDLVHRHRVSSADVVDYAHDTSPRLFAEGEVAMAMGGSYQAEFIQTVSRWDDAGFPQHVGATPPPAPVGRDPVSTVGGTSYVVLRQCEHHDLVIEVLKVAMDPAITGELYRSMWLNLPGPSFNGVLGYDAESLSTQISSMIASGRARPSLPEYVKVSRQLQGMFEAAISSNEPIDNIVQRTAEFISVITELPSRSS